MVLDVAFPLLILIPRKPSNEIASRKAANYVEVLSDYKFVVAISCLWLAHAFERLPGDASPECNRLHFGTTGEIDLQRILPCAPRASKYLFLLLPLILRRNPKF